MPYANPLEHAEVTPERIDQGVDYSVRGGYLVAIADGVVVYAGTVNTGWPGGYVEYRVTQAGPLEGHRIYYAEGVTPDVKVGQTVQAGQRVATLRPYWYSGIEVGFAAGIGTETWARAYGGGFDGVHSTAAGRLFSDLIIVLGGPGGNLVEPVHGTEPNVNLDLVARAGLTGVGTFNIGSVPDLSPADYALDAPIRDAWSPWGRAGDDAMRQARFVAGYVGGVRYCDDHGSIS